MAHDAQREDVQSGHGVESDEFKVSAREEAGHDTQRGRQVATAPRGARETERPWKQPRIDRAVAGPVGKSGKSGISGSAYGGHCVQSGYGEQPPQQPPDPFRQYHSIGTTLHAIEELKRLREVVGTDPEGAQQSLQSCVADHVFSTEQLVGVIQGLISKVIPDLVQDLETLLASVSERYGGTKQPVAQQRLGEHGLTTPGQMQKESTQNAVQTPEPLSLSVPELARETMVKVYGTPKAVVEKKMSNREYMSRFRLNTKFASALLPAYDHTTAAPTIYGALERLLLADITICTVDGRAFEVVYELARTVKNDWLHHRFTTGWAEVVKQLGIEIGDMLVFERWTEDRTMLTMQIVKECQLGSEHPEYAWNRRKMTAAQRKGQF